MSKIIEPCFQRSHLMVTVYKKCLAWLCRCLDPHLLSDTFIIGQFAQFLEQSRSRWPRYGYMNIVDIRLLEHGYFQAHFWPTEIIKDIHQKSQHKENQLDCWYPDPLPSLPRSSYLPSPWQHQQQYKSGHMLSSSWTGGLIIQISLI